MAFLRMNDVLIVEWFNQTVNKEQIPKHLRQFTQILMTENSAVVHSFVASMLKMETGNFVSILSELSTNMNFLRSNDSELSDEHWLRRILKHNKQLSTHRGDVCICGVTPISSDHIRTLIKDTPLTGTLNPSRAQKRFIQRYMFVWQILRHFRVL